MNSRTLLTLAAVLVAAVTAPITLASTDPTPAQTPVAKAPIADAAAGADSDQARAARRAAAAAAHKAAQEKAPSEREEEEEDKRKR